MSRPFRIVTTRYSRFRSATCRLFGCRLVLAIPENTVTLGGLPVTLGGRFVTLNT